MALVVACAPRDVRLGRRALQSGDLDGAVSAFERAAEARPEEGARWLELARACLLAERFPEAREAFARLAALRPADPRPMVEIGFTWELERRYDRALEAYLTAVSVAPEEAYAHRVLGTRLLRWGRPAEAAPALEAATLRAPAHVETWKALALARHGAGDRPGAERAYREGLAAVPGELGLRLGLAALLVNGGEHAEALTLYEAIARDAPELAAAHVARALLLHELGREDEAEAAFEEAVGAATTPAERARFTRRLEAYRALRRGIPEP